MDNLDKLVALDQNTEKNTQETQQPENTISPDLQAINELVRSNSSPKVSLLSGKPFKIGICGGHSSGKALLTEKLMNELSAQGFKVCVVKQDNFDVDSDDFDHYKQSTESPNNVPYVNNQDYQKFLVHANSALDQTNNVNVIIIEGTLILYDKQLREKLDLKIFLHHDQDVRLSRKIYKEVCAKGKDVEQVIHNYLNRLKPLYESIIKPTEQYADIIIPKFGGEFSVKTSDRIAAAQVGFEKINPNILSLLVKIAKANLFGPQGEKTEKVQTPSKQ